MSQRQRRLRNYLLDAPLQLRFTSVLLLGTLLGAGLLGVFLARALNRLADQAERAVEARAAAAQASHELHNAALSKTLLERYGDPQFTAQMERQSRAIDAAYVAEQNQVAEQRQEVQREQRRIGWLVALPVGLFPRRPGPRHRPHPPHRRAGLPGPEAPRRPEGGAPAGALAWPARRR